MNTRINELAKQSGIIQYDSDGKASEVERFARLIVRECAELSVNSQYANTKSEYYEGFNEALIYAGNKIRQHFGIAE